MNIEKLLEYAVKRGASDLHIIPNMAPIIRVDGMLTIVKDHAVLTPEDTQRLVYSVLSLDQQKNFETNLCYEMALMMDQIGNFRASVYHQLHGIAGVFRVVPEKVPGFEELQLPDVLKTLLGLSQGLILLTGPTGSGKSTSLAAMIDYINSFRACNIITIEDPIEFIYQPKRSVFNQLQVGRDTPDFTTALRSALRQDPDVILLSELRDLETMRLALRAAETGHLVMATLHASTAPLAVSRFVEVFPTQEKNMIKNLLSETVQAIIGQTLVKQISGGRIAAFEVFLSTPATRNYIRQDMIAHIESAMQLGGDKGMFTLEQYLQRLVDKNLVKDSIAKAVIASRNVLHEKME